MVGKKTDQIGRDNNTGGFFSNDEATFDKLNQAVNSCHDLVSELVHKSSPPLFRAVVPQLVVPPGTLWQVDYSADGALVDGPRQVTRSTLFLNHPWVITTSMAQPSYRLSHIEIATLDGLPDAMASYFSDDGFFGG